MLQSAVACLFKAASHSEIRLALKLAAHTKANQPLPVSWV